MVTGIALAGKDIGAYAPATHIVENLSVIFCRGLNDRDHVKFVMGTSMGISGVLADGGRRLKTLDWWSQGESNPRPLECHSKDIQFIEFPGISPIVRRSAEIGLSADTLLPGRSRDFLFGVSPVLPCRFFELRKVKRWPICESPSVLWMD